ncbi:hypothetical protein [Singulisphaera acidiphila]|uniref:Uncharacterized protein n=1 Tax=Singulisphaera acidiphila (strain ATCC BAA-1392 / DSM 18658 / VKM B-2454 / MOB10) TaxID=886293 RepID=L0D9R0_SINAD|nr:hypothetical protein [Singulisphaera acidiphila]AGA25977.1 hypothetical protein Sinac_1598 [Singulisphaera acidiphila DSM 18658]
MKPQNRYLSRMVGGMLLFIGLSGTAQAGLIFGNGPLGDFTGSLVVANQTSTTATLTITLTNTSPVANGGYLTAFVLNNPGNMITGISLTSAPANFTLLGTPPFQDGINGAPNGQFDFGVSTGNGFEGGGSPSKGLAVGATGIFTFSLTGTNLSTLSPADFASALSGGTGIGQGPEFFVARFRGFNNNGSDKVPGTLSTVPEPSSLVSCGIAGVIGLSFAWCRRKKLATA